MCVGHQPKPQSSVTKRQLQPLGEPSQPMDHRLRGGLQPRKTSVRVPQLAWASAEHGSVGSLHAGESKDGMVQVTYALNKPSETRQRVSDSLMKYRKKNCI